MSSSEDHSAGRPNLFTGGKDHHAARGAGTRRACADRPGAQHEKSIIVHAARYPVARATVAPRANVTRCGAFWRATDEIASDEIRKAAIIIAPARG